MIVKDNRTRQNGDGWLESVLDCDPSFWLQNESRKRPREMSRERRNGIEHGSRPPDVCRHLPFVSPPLVIGDLGESFA